MLLPAYCLQGLCSVTYEDQWINLFFYVCKAKYGLEDRIMVTRVR